MIDLCKKVIQKKMTQMCHFKGDNMKICQCKKCGKKPSEIDEYVYEAKNERISPEQYVKENEGTYNPENNMFYCTECYIQLGMPLGTA